MNRLFVGGPRHGESEPVLTAVPSPRVWVYAEADSELNCSDEQVVECVGQYLRYGQLHKGEWQYRWFPKEH